MTTKVTPSARGLFKAIKPKADDSAMLFDAPKADKPRKGRDPLDFDPTPPDTTEAVLAVEVQHMRLHGNKVLESAVGAGHVANVLQRHGFDVMGCDVVDRGWPNTIVSSFYDLDAASLPPIHFTNPPYNQINSSSGHGRWLWEAHAKGADYIALLLNADWAAARQHGHDKLLDTHPPSIEYLCCWKIDFTGGGAPPQRNSWFIWDINRPAVGPSEWVRKRLYRYPPDTRQKTMFG